MGDGEHIGVACDKVTRMIEAELAGNQPAAKFAAALPFVLPLVVYLAIGMLEPRFEQNLRTGAVATSSPDDTEPIESLTATKTRQSQRYVVICLSKFVLVGVCLLCFFPSYRQYFPLAINGWGWGAGILGAVIWVGLCSLALEPKILSAMGVDIGGVGKRSQFNPLEQIDSSTLQVVFLVARFGLLVLVVAVMMLAVTAVGVQPSVSAQDATASAGEMSMEGLTFTLLGIAPGVTLPSTAADLQVVRTGPWSSWSRQP